MFSGPGNTGLYDYTRQLKSSFDEVSLPVGSVEFSVQLLRLLMFPDLEIRRRIPQPQSDRLARVLLGFLYHHAHPEDYQCWLQLHERKVSCLMTSPETHEAHFLHPEIYLHPHDQGTVFLHLLARVRQILRRADAPADEGLYRDMSLHARTFPFIELLYAYLASQFRSLSRENRAQRILDLFNSLFHEMQREVGVEFLFELWAQLLDNQLAQQCSARPHPTVPQPHEIHYPDAASRFAQEVELRIQIRKALRKPWGYEARLTMGLGEHQHTVAFRCEPTTHLPDLVWHAFLMHRDTTAFDALCDEEGYRDAGVMKRLEERTMAWEAPFQVNPEMAGKWRRRFNVGDFSLSPDRPGATCIISYYQARSSGESSTGAGADMSSVHGFDDETSHLPVQLMHHICLKKDPAVAMQAIKELRESRQAQAMLSTLVDCAMFAATQPEVGPSVMWMRARETSLRLGRHASRALSPASHIKFFMREIFPDAFSEGVLSVDDLVPGVNQASLHTRARKPGFVLAGNQLFFVSDSFEGAFHICPVQVEAELVQASFIARLHRGPLCFVKDPDGSVQADYLMSEECDVVFCPEAFESDSDYAQNLRILFLMEGFCDHFVATVNSIFRVCTDQQRLARVFECLIECSGVVHIRLEERADSSAASNKVWCLEIGLCPYQEAVDSGIMAQFEIPDREGVISMLEPHLPEDFWPGRLGLQVG